MQSYSLGFSPCPNDTYIFDALVHQKIESDIRFQIVIEDVETLNQLALDHRLDISKISIHALFHVLGFYKLLTSGSALGKGCGPLLIGKEPQLPNQGKIALPGKLTTAALLCKMAINKDFEFIQLPFSEIIPAILDNQVAAGVIIHESRFTYQKFGLKCLLDLGHWWETKTNALIPLGGIAISNKIPYQDQHQIQLLIQQSIEYAERYPSSSSTFIKENAQELNSQVIGDHIALYVNEYSKDLGRPGKRSIQLLYEQSSNLGLLPSHCLNKENLLFVDKLLD